MRKAFLLLAAVALTASLGTGCARMEHKLGRGLSDTFEIVRGGEFHRTFEQTALFDGNDAGFTYGFVHGFDRTIERTGVGLVEVVTFPVPPYGPLLGHQFSPKPVYPDSYTPGLVADSMVATDSEVGFSGGDVAPFLPGSRFRIFETP